MTLSKLLPLFAALLLLCGCSVSTPADGVPAEQGGSPASPALRSSPESAGDTPIRYAIRSAIFAPPSR